MELFSNKDFCFYFTPNTSNVLYSIEQSNELTQINNETILPSNTNYLIFMGKYLIKQYTRFVTAKCSRRLCL